MMKVIAILTIILLQSVLASNNNVFDTEQSVAMNLVANEENFGPDSDDEPLIGKSTLILAVNSDINDVAANDENFLPPDDIVQLDDTSVVANEENFGPPSDGEILVVDNEISPVVARDDNFLPPLDDVVDYFQIHSLYEVDDTHTQVCLQPRTKKQGSTIIVKPCLDEISRSWWMVDDIGQFRNKANPDLCMTQVPQSKLKLKPCHEPDSRMNFRTSDFIYNIFTNEILSSSNSRLIVTVSNDQEESNIVKLVKSNRGNVRGKAENDVTKWAVKFLI